MADTKISALTAASAALGADEIPVNEAGTTKKLTVAQLAAYPGNGGIYNANVPASAQSVSGNAQTYLTGSALSIPAGLQVSSIYRCKFYATKTAAGTGAPAINVYFGTNGTTADTARATITLSAQTAAIDTAEIEVEAVFRSVGSGTSAIIVATAKLSHALAATGFSTSNNGLAIATSGAGFDSTVANSKIGVGVNPGASAAWSVSKVVAELRNVT